MSTDPSAHALPDPIADPLIERLSDLIATELQSLARHLDEARPYMSRRAYKVWPRLRPMAAVSRDHARRLTALLTRLSLPQRSRTFDPSVAAHHYQSLESLLPLLIEEKTRQIAAYEQAVAQVAAAGADHAAAVDDVAATLSDLLDENRRQLAELQQAAAVLA